MSTDSATPQPTQPESSATAPLPPTSPPAAAAAATAGSGSTPITPQPVGIQPSTTTMNVAAKPFQPYAAPSPEPSNAVPSAKLQASRPAAPAALGTTTPSMVPSGLASSSSIHQKMSGGVPPAFALSSVRVSQGATQPTYIAAPAPSYAAYAPAAHQVTKASLAPAPLPPPHGHGSLPPSAAIELDLRRMLPEIESHVTRGELTQWILQLVEHSPEARTFIDAYGDLLVLADAARLRR